MNQILHFLIKQRQTNFVRYSTRFLQSPPQFHFNSFQNQNFVKEKQYSNKYSITNHLTAFLPKDYPELLSKFQDVSYYSLMDIVREVQIKEQQGHTSSNDLTSSQLSFLFSRILFYRQEYDHAIQVLYSLNHMITEQYLNPNHPNHDSYNQTDHNLDLTNSLLEMNHLYHVLGDSQNQEYYLELAEEQLIDFLGTDQQRFEIILKFMQSYRDQNKYDKMLEQQEKLLAFLDRIDYPHNMYPIFKNLFMYFQDAHQRQALSKLGIKMIEKYSQFPDLKEDLQSFIIPTILKELPPNSEEGKLARKYAQNQKLEVRDPLSSRRHIQEKISTVAKLKFEHKYEEALQISHEVLEKIMNDLPNSIPSDLLITAFNNLFVLYSIKNDTKMALEFGEKWVKLSERLKISSQIITSNCNVAAYCLKINQMEKSLNHVESAIKILEQNWDNTDLTDKFLAHCLYFQVKILNQKIKNSNILEELKVVFMLLQQIIDKQSFDSIQLSKIIELYTFLRALKFNRALKQLGLFYQQIKYYTKDLSISKMDYIVSTDISEIDFLEHNYDESIKFINQAIKLYETQKALQEKTIDLPKSPRWITMQYMRGCIEVNRGDVDKGFQTLKKYPLAAEVEYGSVNNSLENERNKASTNIQHYWGFRLQSEIFNKIGQIDLAQKYVNKAYQYSQLISSQELMHNTEQLKLNIEQQMNANQKLDQNQEILFEKRIINDQVKQQFSPI